MTPPTSVAIVRLLQRARAENAAFSPLALSQHNMRPSGDPITLQTSRVGDWQRVNALVKQPVNGLTRYCQPPWGNKVVQLISSGGLKKGSPGAAPSRWRPGKPGPSAASLPRSRSTVRTVDDSVPRRARKGRGSPVEA